MKCASTVMGESDKSLLLHHLTYILYTQAPCGLRGGNQSIN